MCTLWCAVPRPTRQALVVFEIKRQHIHVFNGARRGATGTHTKTDSGDGDKNRVAQDRPTHTTRRTASRSEASSSPTTTLRHASSKHRDTPHQNIETHPIKTPRHAPSKHREPPQKKRKKQHVVPGVRKNAGTTVGSRVPCQKAWGVVFAAAFRFVTTPFGTFRRFND